MRSVTTRLFVAMVAVSLVALALGTWWVRRTVEQQFGRQLIVEQTVERINGEEVVRESRREVPGGAVVSENLQGPVVDVARLNRRLLVALSVVVLGAALVTALVARRVLGPVRALREAVARMTSGESARVVVNGADEIADLGQAFNSMADALARQEQLKRDLTNDIAHELRTPLTDLKCHIEALQDRVVDLTPAALSTLHAEVSHLERLVEDLGELARAESRQLSLSPEAADLVGLVEGVVQHAQPRAATLSIHLSWTGPASAAAWVDPGRFRQVLMNLLDNALVHTPTGGVIRVGVEPDHGWVHVDVHDSGPGIPEAHLAHVFDRFYRVDPSRSRATGGVGLGLAIARQLVEAGGGRIRVSCPPEGGTRFRVSVPVSGRSPSQDLHKSVV